MQVGETERSVANFFDGVKVSIKGTVVDCPGYLELLQETCDSRDPSAPVKYKDAPHRIASGDEVLVGCSSRLHACAPKGARRNHCQKMTNSDNVTCFSWCTFTGQHGAEHFIVQGKETSVNFIPDNAYAISRPDGYFMTADIFEKLLRSVADRIEGSRAQGGLMQHAQKTPVSDTPARALQAACRLSTASCSYWTATSRTFTPTA